MVNYFRNYFNMRAEQKRIARAEELLTMIEKYDHEGLQRLFDNGYDPHTRTMLGGNCLTAALVLKCDLKMIKVICDAGIDLRKCFVTMCKRIPTDEMARQFECSGEVVDYLKNLEDSLTSKHHRKLLP